MRFTAFAMSSRHMSTMTALFFDRAPNSPMQKSTAASTMKADGSDRHHSSLPDHQTAPTRATSSTTDAISKGSAQPREEQRCRTRPRRA